MIAEFSKEKVFWTKRMNLKLVKFIENHPNIWNPKHPKYTSVRSRDKTYAEFASKYGNEFSGQAVKDRWTNIRCTYSNYLRKLNASRARGDAEEFKINWHLWEPCQFLLKVNKKRQNCTTYQGNVDEQETIGNNEDSFSEDSLDTEVVSEPDNMCTKIADNIAQILKGVQNDAFGLENTKNGKVGRAVYEKLSQMNSYEASKATSKIIDILVAFDKDNPNNNRSNKNVKSEY